MILINKLCIIIETDAWVHDEFKKKKKKKKKKDIADSYNTCICMITSFAGFIL